VFSSTFRHSTHILRDINLLSDHGSAEIKSPDQFAKRPSGLDRGFGQICKNVWRRSTQLFVLLSSRTFEILAGTRKPGCLRRTLAANQFAVMRARRGIFHEPFCASSKLPQPNQRRFASHQPAQHRRESAPAQRRAPREFINRASEGLVACADALPKRKPFHSSISKLPV
jgi:hypothetical protein